MIAYLLKRLLLVIPTLFGIMLISFTIIQFAPGGPVERIIAQLTGHDSSIVSRIGGGGGDTLGTGGAQSQMGQGAAAPGGGLPGLGGDMPSGGLPGLGGPQK